jgi:hypothetical protein
MPYTEGVSSTMLRKKLTERIAEAEGDAEPGAGGVMIWFSDRWINSALQVGADMRLPIPPPTHMPLQPPGTGWVQYGLE